MKLLYYLAEANIYIIIFYLAYCLFLYRDTHYQLKRAYLLFICVCSFILPLLQISALRPVKPAGAVPVISNILPKTEVMVHKVVSTPQIIAEPATVVKQPFTLQEGLWYMYLTGAIVLLFIFLMKLYSLFRLRLKEQSIKKEGHRLIYLNDNDAAFSFFNYLFIGNNISGADTIIRHELVHIRQKHSADIIFLELVKIVCWFNPLVYLMQNSLKIVHEYIADEQSVGADSDALAYSAFLVNKVYGTGGSSITHSFFNYNQIKKRIIMLNQQRSGNLARLKYLLALPICMALVCASTLSISKSYALVDLAPAHIKTSSSYASLNARLTVAKKRLKITQNGISTISDQFALAEKNKKVIYTASTITPADKIALLKNNHIKVEIVTDSTRFTTPDGKLILPVVNADGYYLLDHFLHNNINYKAGKGEKGGLVLVGFTLDNDRHIKSAKIVKSAGTKLDALALNGFNAYQDVVNDDPGKNYVLGVYFFTDDYSIFKTDSMQKVPDFAGELIITTYKYPVNLTSKGYEYEERGMGFPNGNKFAEVLIFEKNGGYHWYKKNEVGAADLKMLKDKYGYIFPSTSSMLIQFMHPENVTNKHLSYIFDIQSYLDPAYSDDFFNAIIDTMVYPKQAQKENKSAVVVLNFNLDNAGKIGDVQVARGAGNGFDEAAVNALQTYKASIKDAAGKHSIAIVFCLAEKKIRPQVSDDIKKDGYVGELAVADIKSPFGPPVLYVPKPAH